MVSWGENDLSVSGGSTGVVPQPRREGVEFGENDFSEDLGAPRNISRDQIPSVELGGAAPRTLGIGEGFLQGFASDDQEIINVAAQALFPDQPLSESTKRFGLTREKDIFYVDDDGRLVPVEQSALGAVARGVGKGLPIGAGGVAGVLSAPAASTGVGLAGTIALTGGAAALGETARQGIGDFLLGERSTESLEPLEIAKEGVLAGTGQGIGTGIGRAMEARQVRDIARLNRPEARQTMQRASDQGVRLTPGQATGLRTLLAQEKRLATRVPETVDQMDDFLRQQGDDVIAAFKRNMDDISPRVDAEEVGRGVRAAAQGALEDANAVRAARARPLYEAAFEQTPDVRIDGVLKTIDDQLEAVPDRGAMSRALRAARGFLTGPNGSPVNSLERLHNARIELDNIIQTRQAGTASLSNTVIGKLRLVKSALTRALDEGSATNDAGESLYQIARRTFSESSGDVDDAFGSALGRIANLNDDQILSTVRQAFSGTTRSPAMVGRLRTALERQDPQAWQSLKRVWIDDAVTDALKPAQSGAVINPAGKVLGVLNSPQMSANLKAALSADEAKALSNLKLVLGRAAKFTTGGSDTAANLALDKEAMDAATPALAKATSLLEVWKYPQMLQRSLGEAQMRRQAQQMVELITSGDDAAIDGLKALRELTPAQWKALAVGGQASVLGASALD